MVGSVGVGWGLRFRGTERRRLAGSGLLGLDAEYVAGQEGSFRGPRGACVCFIAVVVFNGICVALLGYFPYYLRVRISFVN